MSESLPGTGESDPVASDHPTTHTHSLSPAKGRILLRLGGWLGVLASTLTMLIFLVGCFGKEAIFAKAGLSSIFGLAVAPLLMSVPGLLLSIAGGARRGFHIDPNVLAALFVNFLGLATALVEIAVWRQWPLLPMPTGS